MALDPREVSVTPADLGLLSRMAVHIARHHGPCERVDALLEAREFGERHRHCAVLRSERPAALAGMGTLVTAECVDCGEGADFWIAPASVTNTVSLS